MWRMKPSMTEKRRALNVYPTRVRSEIACLKCRVWTHFKKSSLITPSSWNRVILHRYLFTLLHTQNYVIAVILSTIFPGDDDVNFQFSILFLFKILTRLIKFERQCTEDAIISTFFVVWHDLTSSTF